MASRMDAARASQRAGHLREIGRRLAAARIDEKLTQAELGRELNVSASTVTRWEAGGSCPDAAQLVTLSAIVGRPVHHLLGVEP